MTSTVSQALLTEILNTPLITCFPLGLIYSSLADKPPFSVSLPWQSTLLTTATAALRIDAVRLFVSVSPKSVQNSMFAKKTKQFRAASEAVFVVVKR